MFKNLQDESGCAIDVYTHHHLTIAGVAFEGIYCKHFLPAETIGVVLRPLKSVIPSNKYCGGMLVDGFNGSEDISGLLFV